MSQPTALTLSIRVFTRIGSACRAVTGTRIPCIEHGPAVEVTIEPVRNANLAHRHLWRWLARSWSPVLTGSPSPSGESLPPGPGLPIRGPVEDRELTWWARDDRGNHYLAIPNDDRNLLRSPTPLDPLACALDLMPTAIDCQAIISIPLQWMASDG